MIRRRHLLAGAALAGLSPAARAQVQPRVTFLSQWSSGSDGAAISGLGKRFEQEGGIWQHMPTPGFTTEMLSKLRADIAAGRPPAASQLKGPEIAAWSKLAPTINLDPMVPAEYEKLMSNELARVHRPEGHWLALPLQIFRTNDMFLSRAAMAKVGATKAPTTWAEFNELATAMKAAGITPLANGGLRWDHGTKLEIALAGISADAYRAALMHLDPKALQGPEMQRAFVQLRKFVGWMSPATTLMHFSINLPELIKGQSGMLLMGGFAHGFIRSLGGRPEEILVTSAPQDEGKPCFVLNADSMIFWKHVEPDLVAGQKLLARLVLQKDVQEKYSQTTGSIPVRTDIDLSGREWTDGQRTAAAVRREAIKTGRVLLSFAHNMALPNHVASAMIDVVLAFLRDDAMTPDQATKKLAAAAAAASAQR
jgi:glucose/mannose transport system substrate-binding protein